MILDNTLIAYEYFKNLYVPNEVYTSGEKEETKLIDKYSINTSSAPLLTLKEDIINDEGYGLKKGYYNVFPDKYLDFLLIYQSGKLKAKIPVIRTKVYETNNPKQIKPQKMSFSRYKRQQEKEYRKYLKGENPSEVEWNEVEIHYFDEQNAWILIYNSNNIELVGIIKL